MVTTGCLTSLSTPWGVRMKSIKVEALKKRLPHRATGIRWAVRENFTEAQHNRRLNGLFKTWDVDERKKRGEVIMSTKENERRKFRRRLRLKEGVALQARDVQEVARKYARATMEMIAEIAGNPTERAADRIAAGNVLLDRAYGKANQTNTNVHVDNNGRLTEISSGELTTRIEETIRAIEITTKRTVKKEESGKQLVDLRK